MTDKELLELAAKAAGMRLNHQGQPTTGNYYDSADFNWNPLTDDGDALRLAVELGLELRMSSVFVIGAIPLYTDNEVFEPKNDDPYAATRRAIVRAAAEIGRRMG